MVNTAKKLEIATNGFAVEKQKVLESLSVKLNGDARNLIFLATAENQAKGRFVGNILAGTAPGTAQVDKNLGAYIRFVDGTRGSQPVTEFSAELDQVVDNILEETAREAKAAINAKFDKSPSTTNAFTCSTDLAEIDTLLAGAKGKKFIEAEWKKVKNAVVAR